MCIVLIFEKKFERFNYDNVESQQSCISIKVVMFSNGLQCRLPFPSCLGGVPKDSGSDELLPVSMGNREPVILNVYDMVS